MKILVVGRSIQLAFYRGIGRYSFNLLRAIAARMPDWKFIFLLDKAGFDISNHIRENYTNYKIVFTDEAEYFIGKKRFDFLFEPHLCDSYYFDFSHSHWILERCDRVVGILFDMIPVLFKYLPIDEIVKLKVIANMNLCEHIFVDSKCAMSDAMRFLSLPKDCFTNLYGSTDTKIFSHKAQSPYNSQKRTNDIVACLGNEPRKNIYGAARGFAIAYQSGLLPKNARLCVCCNLCGAEKHVAGIIEDELKSYSSIELGKNIVLYPNHIPDKDMVKFYQTARATIYSSFYEGLGIPILESYAAQTPCIASGISSMAEIISPECAFDPYDDYSIADKIVQIYNDQNLCKKSLEFGNKFIKEWTWEKAAGLVIDKLKQLYNKPKDKRIAVFSITDPTPNGIAKVTNETFSTLPDKYDIFTPIWDMTSLDLANEASGADLKNIFSMNNYCDLQLFRHYMASIFVLGNGSMHFDTMYKCTKMDYQPNRWLYLHEIYLADLANEYCCRIGFDINTIKHMFYGHEIKTIPNFNPTYFRFIVHETGIKNIIVNNDFAKEMILQEMGLKWDGQVVTTFLHLNNMSNIGKAATDPFTNHKYVIGTFGIPNDYYKQTNIVIEATSLLAEQGLDIKLIIAGYDAGRYNLDELNNSSILINSPNDKLLFQLMKSVNLAIQLRPHQHGESSGTISQLFSLGTQYITTRGFMDNPDFRDAYDEVSADVSPKSLAKAIRKCLFYPKKFDPASIIAKYSSHKLAEKIYREIIQ